VLWTSENDDTLLGDATAFLEGVDEAQQELIINNVLEYPVDEN